jgi:acyl-CoA reductase-like NAD-dependent aldehyde dehydrogenase
VIDHPNLSMDALDLVDPTSAVSEGILLASSINEILVIDPMTGEEIGEIADSCAADADIAVKRARVHAESGRWGQLTGSERGLLLDRLADILEGHADAFAEIGTLESGTPTKFSRHTHIEKPLELVHAAVIRSADLANTTQPATQVEVAIVGYHQPLTFTLLTVAHALAQGNPSIVVPSPLAPLATIAFMNCLLEADFPKGAVQLVLGSPAAIEPILTGEKTERIAVSLPEIMTAEMVPISMEIETMSEEEAVSFIRKALLGYASEPGRIPGVSRLKVSTNNSDKLRSAVEGALDSVVVGDPWGTATDVGPLIRPSELGNMAAYLEHMRDLGAIVRTGSGSKDSAVYPVPAVIVGIQDACTAVNRALCAPVITIFEHPKN